MKRIWFIVLTLILVITTSAYAVGLIDTLTCKKVYLRLVKSLILVKYITGEVKYTQAKDGTWIHLAGPVKAQYQSMYDAQLKRDTQ
jgi:hypothetical protein